MIKRIFFFCICLVCLMGFDISVSRFHDMKGIEYTYRELIESSDKTIIFLWTSGCYGCRKALEFFNKNPLKETDIKIFYVNIGEGKGSINRLIKKMQLSEAITDNFILDEQGLFAYEFNVISVPLFIFFKDGEEIYKSNYINTKLIEAVFGNG